MRLIFVLFCTLLVSAVGKPAFSQPTLHQIPGEQMRFDAAFSSVTSGSDWDLDIVADDENTGPLYGFKWWHLEVRNIDSGGETLNFEVSNTGVSEPIRPVWSIDGGDTYERVPASANYFRSGTTHFFTLTTPPGVTSIRVAKYFPYTFTHFEAYRNQIKLHPMVTETQIGTSGLTNPIYMYTITNTAIPEQDKERVWIHSAVHPSENTAYFNSEGLINWLTSDTYESNLFLERVIINIVIMANPDGVQVGNYRTNASGVNLEVQWGSPYNNTTPAVLALRTKIEEFMGTSTSPGISPIKVLLNLHSTHGYEAPYHFVHVGNYNINGTGVIPEVNALENKWVNAFKNRSVFVNDGNSRSSTLGSSRPYVESMMHDRYTVHPSGAWEPVMAITFEGTYDLPPSNSANSSSTREDYVQVGMEMGLALADYFEIDLTSSSLPEAFMIF